MLWKVHIYTESKIPHGRPTDNLKGVPGIGEKTVTLILQHT